MQPVPERDHVTPLFCVSFCTVAIKPCAPPVPTVAVVGEMLTEMTFTVKATGKTASMYMQHWFRFADSEIVFFRGSEDTDQSARAFS